MRESKQYEKATRAQLFAQYKIMEDVVIDILNQNKKDSKDHSKAVRKMMQGRRGEIKELWHAERANYHQLDLVIQLKKDTEEVKKIFQETAKEQKLNMDILELEKEEAGVYAGDERSAQEIRNEAFMELDMKRLDREFREVAEAVESCAKVKLPTEDPVELGERFKLEFIQIGVYQIPNRD
jgi:hypothetical protein